MEGAKQLSEGDDSESIPAPLLLSLLIQLDGSSGDSITKNG